MSLIKRRVIAVIAAALAIIMLGIALIFTLQYEKTIEFVDYDGQVYHIKNEDGTYKLYEKKSDAPLEIDEKYQYFVTKCGTLVSIDATTGEVLDTIPVDGINDFIGTEQIGFSARVFIFPRLVRDDILSIEVHNSEGSYTFQRLNEELQLDPNGDFAIKGSPLTEYSGEKFAELIVGTGYALSTHKIKDPIKNANGEYTEYGLAPEVRERPVVDEETGKELVDEETGEVITEKYNYEPAYYVVTEISGKRHKMIVGDATVTGEGYYVQYVEYDGDTEVKRDAVYVVGTSIGNTVLATIEDFAQPIICYPLSMNNYYDVADFVLGHRVSDTLTEDYKDMYKTQISFSYVDLSLRQDTTLAVAPYEFAFGLEGYNASDSAISNCLYNLYSPNVIGAKKVGPSSQDLVDYGFFTETLDKDGNVVKNEKGEIQYTVFSDYVLSYDYDVLNDTNDGVEQTIHQQILISARDYEETGNYYVYSVVYLVTEDKDGNRVNQFMYAYDYISEVSGDTFNFLLWDDYDWVNPSYIDQNIVFIQSIKLNSPEYSANFYLDNSLSDQSGGISSASLFINATDSTGNSSTSFGVMEILDTRGYLWVVSSSGIKLYNATTGADISKNMNKDYTFYDYNDLGVQVYCRTEQYPIGSGDGKIKKIWVNGKELANTENATVQVTKNFVTVTREGGEKVNYVRYETELFRRYYQTLLYATLVDAYELSDAEEQELINDPTKELATIEITLKEADKVEKNEAGEEVVIPGEVRVDVYKFYRISSRKAYITLNGNGGFYVYSSRVQKFITDAQKYFKLEDIDPRASK